MKEWEIAPNSKRPPQLRLFRAGEACPGLFLRAPSVAKALIRKALQSLPPQGDRVIGSFGSRSAKFHLANRSSVPPSYRVNEANRNKGSRLCVH